MLNFKNPILNDDIIFQLIADYLNINIFVFYISPYITLDNIYVYYSKTDSDKFCKYKPSIFICNKNNIYNAIIANKNKLVCYSEHYELIDTLYENYIKDNIEKVSSNDETEIDKMLDTNQDI